MEIAVEEGDLETERQLHREALWLETSIATAPAECLNDVGLKLGLLLDHSPCGGIREAIQTHNLQAIGTVMAFILKADGVVSDYGAKLLHMDAVSTHRGPAGRMRRLSDRPAPHAESGTEAIKRALQSSPARKQSLPG